MTAHPQHCGAVVPAAVRLVLDGQHQDADRLLEELTPHAAQHALFVAVSLAADVAACLNARDAGHGDRDVQRFALRLAETEPS